MAKNESVFFSPTDPASYAWSAEKLTDSLFSCPRQSAFTFPLDIKFL